VNLQQRATREPAGEKVRIMSDDAYRNLAKVLDTLPNGFPATDSGLEIRILERIFTPEEAELVCQLRLSYETPAQIAERTGRPLEELDPMLMRMWEQGQIDGGGLGPTRVFRMLPWVVGIWEMQVNRLDAETAKLCDEYYEHFAPQLFGQGTRWARIIPIEQDAAPERQALSYDRVAGIIEANQSFAVEECVCRKQKRLLGEGCDHPLEICLGVASEPDAFADSPWGRPISKQEAYALMEKAEDAGLVHLTTNTEEGPSFICSCCGCCCVSLMAITRLGLTDVVNSDFYCQIDADLCVSCGDCGDGVCPVNAISEGEEAYRIDRRLCIGCGVCISHCNDAAMALAPKPATERVARFADGDAMQEELARQRGVDFGAYK
jgi:Pyruvate/2-oxoacid:ferredoxin oxidoreductase delta subunit